jgi:hypothetical protein
MLMSTYNSKKTKACFMQVFVLVKDNKTLNGTIHF